MATHSSILAWSISWIEEPGGLQSMGSQRVGHDWATNSYYIFRVCWYVLKYSKRKILVSLHDKIWSIWKSKSGRKHLSWEQRQAPSQAPTYFLPPRIPTDQGRPSSMRDMEYNRGHHCFEIHEQWFHLLGCILQTLDSRFTLPGTFLEALEIVTKFWGGGLWLTYTFPVLPFLSAYLFLWFLAFKA